jgi:hypothetical protein
MGGGGEVVAMGCMGGCGGAGALRGFSAPHQRAGNPKGTPMLLELLTPPELLTCIGVLGQAFNTKAATVTGVASGRASTPVFPGRWLPWLPRVS